MAILEGHAHSLPFCWPPQRVPTLEGSWTAPAEGAGPTADHGVDLGAAGAVLLGRGLCGLLGPSWAPSLLVVQPGLAAGTVTGRVVALLEKGSFFVATEPRAGGSVLGRIPSSSPPFWTMACCTPSVQLVARSWAGGDCPERRQVFT